MTYRWLSHQSWTIMALTEYETCCLAILSCGGYIQCNYHNIIADVLQIKYIMIPELEAVFIHNWSIVAYIIFHKMSCISELLVLLPWFIGKAKDGKYLITWKWILPVRVMKTDITGQDCF